jgi:hypothetical protein
MANFQPNIEPALTASRERQGLFISRYPVIEKIQFDPMRVSTSRDQDIASLTPKIRKPVFEGETRGNIEKWFLPIELSHFSDMGFTVTKGSLRVDPHRHPGTMFTVLIDGRLRINGVELTKGDWYLVPPNNEYGIETVDGYESVFAYNTSC